MEPFRHYVRRHLKVCASSENLPLSKWGGRVLVFRFVSKVTILFKAAYSL